MSGKEIPALSVTRKRGRGTDWSKGHGSGDGGAS